MVERVIMKLYENERYKENIRLMAGVMLPWNALKRKRILIAGATGMLGRCLVDLIMYKNEHDGLACSIMALSRDEKKACKKFPRAYFDSGYFSYREFDICNPFDRKFNVAVEYVLNFASNTHPIEYATRPIETMVSNIYGTKNLLEFCSEQNKCRFVFLSSVEIYGENRGDKEFFDEQYMGYLDSNTLRAGYPESKRACEALCQAYQKEKGTDVVIVRFPRIFGPTMKEDDSKAIAQFIKRAVLGRDVVLKSDGSQYYSFLYVMDAVIGLLSVMLRGVCGEAYNVADISCDSTLKELAVECARIGKVQVTYELPNDVERSGCSVATKARLSGEKVRKLGWKPIFPLERGLEQTIDILRECTDIRGML